MVTEHADWCCVGMHPPHSAMTCCTCGAVKPPLGEVPYLPPKAYCEDHQGDRMSGLPCPNCRPLTEVEKVAHRQAWEARRG